MSKNNPHIRAWLTFIYDMGRSNNTIDAYARAMESYLTFCKQRCIDPIFASRLDISHYVREISQRGKDIKTKEGVADNTVKLRLTAIRLFYDYLVEEKIREDNAIPRGNFRQRKKGPFPLVKSLPWIPNARQWQDILKVVSGHPIRNRLMFALAYDAGLRRGELCSL